MLEQLRRRRLLSTFPISITFADAILLGHAQHAEHDAPDADWRDALCHRLFPGGILHVTK